MPGARLAAVPDLEKAFSDPLTVTRRAWAAHGCHWRAEATVPAITSMPTPPRSQSPQQTWLPLTCPLFLHRRHCPEAMSQNTEPRQQQSSALSQHRTHGGPHSESHQARLARGADSSTSSSCSHPQAVTQSRGDLRGSLPSSVQPPWPCSYSAEPSDFCGGPQAAPRFVRLAFSHPSSRASQETGGCPARHEGRQLSADPAQGLWPQQPLHPGLHRDPLAREDGGCRHQGQGSGIQCSPTCLR